MKPSSRPGGSGVPPTVSADTETRLSRFCEGIVEACWLAALIAVPLVFDLHSAGAFEPTKVVLLRSIALVAALAWCIAALERGTRPGIGWLRAPLARPVVLLVAASCLSSAFSLSPFASLWGSSGRLQGTYSLVSYLMLFAAVAAHLRTRAQLERIVTTVIVTSVPVALYAILQRSGLDPLEITPDPRRVGSSLGAANFLGSWMVLVLPLTLARLADAVGAGRAAGATRQAIEAGAYGLVLAVQVLALFFGQSRGPLVGALAGGFVMGLALLLHARRRWAWRAWVALAIAAVGLVSLLNVRGTGLDRLLEAVRGLPHLERLARLTETGRGTGKVRLLIWDAALRRIAAREPVGIPDDELAGPDRFHALRPLLGYGPESMLQAFASVHPAELAHFEARESSADRAHNEIIDRLLMTGALGLVAFYALILGVLRRALENLRPSPDDRARRRTSWLLIAGGLLGALAPYLLGGSSTLAPLGSGLGLAAALVVCLIRRGERPDDDPVPPTDVWFHAALLGTFVAYLVQIQFLFPVAATLTYFWVYAGLLVAHPGLARDRSRATDEGAARSMVAYGLAAALTLGLLGFAFATPHPRLGPIGRGGTGWLLFVTWSVGAAVVLTRCASPGRNGRSPVLAYGLGSLVGAATWALFHSVFGSASVAAGEPLAAADSLARHFGALEAFALLSIIGMGAALACRSDRPRARYDARRAWAYPLVLVVAGIFQTVRNTDTHRAGIYRKEGDRFADARQWEPALAAHRRAHALAPHDDSTLTVLAQDYEMKVQDPRITGEQRAEAWTRGAEALREARRLDPYDVDNTANLGRYYLTLGQSEDPARLEEALDLFGRATVLAPNNVVYHNLWARTKLAMGDPRAALARLQRSIDIDPRFPPTWRLLGDVHATDGRVDDALAAHLETIEMWSRASDGWEVFADASLEARLRFYVSAGRAAELIAAMLRVSELHRAAPERPARARLQWAIGRTYELSGEPELARPYFEAARALGGSD